MLMEPVTATERMSPPQQKHEEPTPSPRANSASDMGLRGALTLEGCSFITFS